MDSVIGHLLASVAAFSFGAGCLLLTRSTRYLAMATRTQIRFSEFVGVTDAESGAVARRVKRRVQLVGVLGITFGLVARLSLVA